MDHPSTEELPDVTPEVFVTKFSLVSIFLLAGAGSVAIACSSSTSDDSSPAGGAGGSSGSHTGGGAGSSSAGKGGTGGGTGGSASTQAGAGGEGGSAEPSTLYSRLGGHEGIAAALDSIVTEELKNPIIASYFSQQASSLHKPTRADIEECFTNFLGKAANGPELYPIKATSGYQCRDMATAHATLGIGSGTFDLFVMIAGEELTALGVLPDDVAAVASALNGSKPQIVTPSEPSGAQACHLPASCALPVVGEGGAPGDGGAGGAQ